jgi:hypothetical protein
MSESDAQRLLDTGVVVGDAAYNVEGQFAYRAQEHAPNRWHGHPIPWSRLPNDARRELVHKGRLTDKDFLAALRRNLGSEFR